MMELELQAGTDNLTTTTMLNVKAGMVLKSPDSIASCARLSIATVKAKILVIMSAKVTSFVA